MTYKDILVRHGSTIVLRAIVIILGLVVLAICTLLIPPAVISGETGHYAPILLGVCVTAVPFLTALYQVLKLLGYVDRNTAFCDASTRALGRIKISAISIAVVYAAGLPYVHYAAQIDDAPGVVVVGLVFTFAATTIAVFASVLQKVLQSAIEIQSENDLTV